MTIFPRYRGAIFSNSPPKRGFLPLFQPVAQPWPRTKQENGPRHRYSSSLLSCELINEIKQHGKSLGIKYLPSKGDAHLLSFGKGNRTGVDPEIIDVDKRLEVMREGRVAIATAESQPSAQGYPLNGKRGEAWSRLYNESIHDLVKRYPQRFSVWRRCRCRIPCVPQASWNTRFAAQIFRRDDRIERERQLFDGKDFDPFWKKAEELDVLMIMHPDSMLGSHEMGTYGRRTVCGNPADTTLSVAFMIYGGVFDRFPKLKLGLLHGGGFFPSHLGRFDQGFKRSGGREPFPARNLRAVISRPLFRRPGVSGSIPSSILNAWSARIMSWSEQIIPTLWEIRYRWKKRRDDFTEAEREAMLHGDARALLKLSTM